MSITFVQKKGGAKGKCHVCGKSCMAGNHKACSEAGEKANNEIMVPHGKGRVIAKGTADKANKKQAAKNYRKGKLPPWMFS